MPHLTPLDEQLVHQLPVPLSQVALHHQHWRESLFFVMHPTAGHDGDAVILTFATYPARGELDSFQLGRVGGTPILAIHRRQADGDPHTMTAGPVRVDVVEPFRELRLRVADVDEAPVAMDVTFHARTAHHALRRGTMTAGHEVIWDQSHMVQSGTYTGWYRHDGVERRVDGWWGQRDHSWGVRDHARCPMWMWLALQLDDGMIGGWHWELPNGARVLTDLAWCPADGGDPWPVIDLHHALDWVDAEGRPISYGRDGDGVAGIAGRVELTMEGGEQLGLAVEGRWAQPYGQLGGGQNLVTVTMDDGRVGNGIVELTGAHHHRYFPVTRAEGLPPDG